MVALQDDDEPRSYHEAISYPTSNEWMKAMNEEIESIRTNQAWDLVDFLLGCKAIENKWALKIKHKVDCSIERYKARLIAKCYTQKEGVDYEETFSSVIRFASIRTILTIVAHLDLELFQWMLKLHFSMEN
jgi:hypothetical protein